MTTNVLVAFYSTYGHVHRMALAVAEGAERRDAGAVAWCTGEGWCWPPTHTDHTKQLRHPGGGGPPPARPATLAGTDGSRQPVEAELTTARNLGSRLARVAGRLKNLRVS